MDKEILKKLKEAWIPETVSKESVRIERDGKDNYLLPGFGHGALSKKKVSQEEAVKIIQSKGKGDYIVTRDMVPVLQERYGLELSQRQQNEIRLEEERMANLWRTYVPDRFNYEVLDTEKIAEELSSMTSDSKAPVVSLSRVYAPNADLKLDATRITDAETAESQLGTRNPESTLEEQVDKIAREEDKVALADSGIFTGETLNEVGRRLRERDIEITEAYLGVAPFDYQQRLNFEAYPAKVVNIGLDKEDSSLIGEWIEGRDFAPPIEGRKTEEGGIIPYNQNLGWMSVSKGIKEKASEEMDRYGERILEILDLGYETEEVFGENVELRD